MVKFRRKTPIAWYQLTREKTRLAVSLAGIAFADILMFIQLGFKDALYDTSVRPHYALNADLFLVNPQFETFFAVKSISRANLYQATGISGVESIGWLQVDKGLWRNPTTNTDRPILVFGIDPANSAFKASDINQHLDQLKMLDRVVFDQAGRPEYGAIASLFQQSNFLETEMNGSLIQVAGVFTMGASFVADGNVITSDSTFMQLFPNRHPDAIDVGLIRLQPGADRAQVQAAIAARLPSDIDVLTVEDFAAREKAYWANATPIGFVFGLGAVVGFIVGTVIVYQVLYSDVSDHLPEYATLKAMGYSDRYLVGVLIQESIILAVLGFLPGFALSIGLYQIAQVATRLPIGMTLLRAVTVLVLTLIMCIASGTVAMHKLRTADPADIF
ncbi:MAG: FtsX-like permease family protein [Leptolyngbyaceae cyanobacterium SM1_3_5]|nr:FtsX-like permease family protein [Leptolyngbyaceae cyanobacterium SM1_3_5]